MCKLAMARHDDANLKIVQLRAGNMQSDNLSRLKLVQEA
jgi:hypothetical protein